MMAHALTLLALLSLSSCTTTDAFAEWKGDPRIPDYGSSAHDRWHEAGKHYPGDQYGTPYAEPKSNVQRLNEEQAHRDTAEQQRWKNYGDNRRDNSGQYGGDKCRSLWGC